MSKKDENAGFRELVKGLQTVLAKATKQMNKPAKKKKKSPKKQQVTPQVVIDPIDKLIQDTEKECSKLVGFKTWLANSYNRHKLTLAEVSSMKANERFAIKLDGDDDCGPLYVAGFELSPMPGCHPIIVSHGMSVEPGFRNKGLNNVLNAFKIELAKLCGYSVLICTDRVDNVPERKTLAKNGWKNIHSFKNRSNGAAIDITVKDIPV